MSYRKAVNPELRIIAKKHPYNKFILRPTNRLLKRMERITPIEDGVTCRSVEIKGSRNLPLNIKIYEPQNCDELLPGLLYIHGGAFSYRASLHHILLAMEYAKKARCRVVFPDYHLSPKYKYPTAYEDVIEAYKYIHSHLSELRIDSKRIGIGGDSAGGMLSAMVCNGSKAAGVPTPHFQLLVYPLTGVDLKTESMKKYVDTPIWRATYNVKMWKWYFGSNKYDYSMSPMHCDIEEDYPTTYIETAQYDCVHDEGVLFAQKLRDAGVKVVLNETQGTIHGYDSAWFSEIVKENIGKRIAFLKQT